MTQRRVLALATPIIGENLLQTMVAAVDTFMVARLGAAAVAGVGTGFEIVFFIISILSAIDIGATVLVSQAIGAGERHRANHLARQAIVWGILLAVPVSVAMYFAAPSIIALFGTEPDVAAAATTYLQITAATSVALFLSFVCGAVLRGAGDSRTPLAAAVMANVVNVVVAYVLIFGHFGFPALGVAGSAIGAAAGRGIGAAYMLLAMARGRKAISLHGGWGWRPEFPIARQLLTLGVPAAVEQVLSSGAFMTLIAVVALIGTSALAASRSRSPPCRSPCCPPSVSPSRRQRSSVRVSARAYRPMPGRPGPSRCAGPWSGWELAACWPSSSAIAPWVSSRPIQR